MITFHDVSKTYGDGTEALKSLNLTINKGEFLVLIGPSGCGKTTTMKMINRLIDPTNGTITLHGKELGSYNIQELRWNTGYVLQQIALFPHMTIAENIAIVPEMKKWDKEKITKRIDELLEMVGLEPEVYRNRKPAELSGGQQQRIGVIRALAGDPEVILMDEPFSALDPISREQLQQDIRALQQKIKKTILFVTHDMDEAFILGDRIGLMKDGEIIQIDTPDNLIHHPKNSYVKEFIGERKNLWLTSVDEILNKTSNHIIFEDKIGKISTTPLFVKDKDNKYLGLLLDNEVRLTKYLNEEDTLRDSIEVFKETDLDMLPVLKDGILVGILSYKDIVMFLEEKNQGKKDV